MLSKIISVALLSLMMTLPASAQRNRGDKRDLDYPILEEHKTHLYGFLLFSPYLYNFDEFDPSLYKLDEDALVLVDDEFWSEFVWSYMVADNQLRQADRHYGWWSARWETGNTENTISLLHRGAYDAVFIVREHDLGDVVDLIEYGWHLAPITDEWITRKKDPQFSVVEFHYYDVVGPIDTIQIDRTFIEGLSEEYEG